ncbi:DNA cytosine methyltransferase [Streptococcus uberis]|uniref:DNA cytosine methyltransferase n=1 Tax=Streptococcus uberis TaxID=1349 RepID=UPI0006204482|nr:DNA cytosine methyltransferase [Streptococcus uberis]KKF60385.1 restriction endonuclease HaeIII [Streptococcus uberis B362]MCK1218574.1 DNA cytosine methyltransferase [Streptococcus uberis]MCK1246386.1 DNA cytosine methyltransferase [Streptococcus uberis]MCR4258678.1 DNA cytosine methyltransferase [Streptococcus uberis]MTB59035.1 DNA (cytosine-5-)-methyltransferase [Streptococcus uberis]
MGKIIAIDLFSGAGGTTSGLKKSGISVEAAVEIDRVASETYRLNNPEVSLFTDDIHNITGNQLLSAVNLEDGDRILLVACPPCQGFSTIGTNDENDERNQLIFQYMRLIEEINPDMLLMENVSGMTRAKNKQIFSKFTNKIKQKYNIVYDVLNTADYGVPQIRKRLVLHGIRKDIVDEEFELCLPLPSHSKDGENNLQQWINAEVIMDLPKLHGGEEYIGEGIYNHIANKLSDKNIARIRYIRDHGGSRKSLPEELQLKCHLGRTGHGDVYGILDITKPSITITGGCMSYSKGRFGHPRQDRALSAREAARLQSFDDDYIFIGTRSQLAKQIGNAVPVGLAKASGNYFQTIFREFFD